MRRFLRRNRRRPFRIEPLEHGRGFRLSGELDLFNVEEVRETLEPELHGTLVLDFAEVDFVDDSGLGLLVAAIRKLGAQGGSLVLRNPQDQIVRVLEITGLIQVDGLRIERS